MFCLATFIKLCLFDYYILVKSSFYHSSFQGDQYCIYNSSFSEVRHTEAMFLIKNWSIGTLLYLSKVI